jgi:hypothetical protein
MNDLLFSDLFKNVSGAPAPAKPVFGTMLSGQVKTVCSASSGAIPTFQLIATYNAVIAPGSNPTLLYNTVSTLVRLENKHIFYQFQKSLWLLQRWRCR